MTRAAGPREPRCGPASRWYFATCRVIDAPAAGTVRASSLVEDLNCRLRTYFSLRRHLRLGLPGVVAVLLNHRMLERSKRPERRRLTPAKLLPGAMHGHWLELLGFSRFARPA